MRTALGAAWISVYLVMLAGGGNDLIATHLHLSLNAISCAVRIGFFVVPVAVFVITKRWCLGLQQRDRDKVLHGRETGVIKRLPHGEFTEVHAGLAPAELHRLTRARAAPPLEPPPAVDENGVAHPAGALTRTRARLSRGFHREHARIPEPTAEEYRGITEGHGH